MVENKLILDGLVALRDERRCIAARLDALDLAITNLELLYPAPAPKRAVKRVERRKRPRLVTGVLHRVAAASSPKGASDASERRAILLAEIGKVETGLTVAELKKRLPKMAAVDRSNALTALKGQGAIRRTGNTWVKVA
jgi:hypothetical protein